MQPHNPAPQPGLDQDAAEIGSITVKALYATIKLGALYGFPGRVAREVRAKLMTHLANAFARYGGARLRHSNETLYFNDARLRMDFDGYLAFRYVAEFMEHREIGQISIPGGVDEPEIVSFMEALLEVDLHAEDCFAASQEMLSRHGVEHIEIDISREVGDERQEDEQGGLHDASIRTFFRSVFVMRSLVDQQRAGHDMEIRKAKRVVQEMVDVIQREDTTLLALIAIKSFGDYVANHATNVAAMSIAVGHRIGMPRPMLAEIGLCGLLHDCGRALVDEQQTAGEIDPHTKAGARLLMRQAGFSPGGLRASLAARWHHENPVREDGSPAPLVHRILRVVDFYDTLTTSAGQGRPPLHTETVIRMMARDAGQRFDPLTVRALGSLIGPVPMGTVVDLDTGERGVVTKRNPHVDDPYRPMVKVFMDEMGDDVEDGPLIDLARVDREKGRFEREILQTYSPTEIFREPRDFVRVL